MSNQELEAGGYLLPEKSLKELFAQSHDRGRAGLPLMSLSMGRGLVPRNQDERRVETNLGDEEHRLVRTGELAYNMMRMWQGVCSLAEEDCLVSPAYVVVRPLDGMDSKFSEYLLTYEETVAQFKRLSFGVVDDRLRLYYKDFERVRVKVPSPPAQRKIAEILGTLDNLIEKTEALIAKYQAVKQGMIHDLFTRGVDEHGLLRPPQAEAPHLYQPSPLGMIPNDWDIRKLSDIADVNRGKFTARPRDDPRFYGGPSPFIQTGDVTNSRGRYLISFSQTLNDLGTSVSKEFPAGTILVTIAANIADTAILGRSMYLPDSVVGVVVHRNSLIRFVELCIRRSKPKLEALAPQSAQKNINLEDLRPLPIPWPTCGEQQRIIRVYEAKECVLIQEENHRAKLLQTKMGLMQDLLTGKVRGHLDPAEEAFSD